MQIKALQEELKAAKFDRATKELERERENQVNYFLGFALVVGRFFYFIIHFSALGFSLAGISTATTSAHGSLGAP